MTPTPSRRNRDFTHISINRGRGGSLADRRNLLKKRVFSLSAVLFSAYNGAEGLRSDGVSAGEMVIPSSSISSPCVPNEYRLPYRRQTDNTYMVSRQSTSMPSISLEEYWSPPRRKNLCVVAVRPTKRDWAAPAEPHRTQKPQLLCARCGRTWEPRQYILRAGRLPKRCPHCASPRWNQPYVRNVSRNLKEAADAY